MRPRTTPTPLDRAIQIYVVSKGPTWTCGPIARSNTRFSCKVQFCFGKHSNQFWSVKASIDNPMRVLFSWGLGSRALSHFVGVGRELSSSRPTPTLAEIEKLEDDLYDEAILRFEIKLAEVNGDHKRAGELATYADEMRKRP